MALLAVAGLGRCGSSLTMQMLAAGGVPCVGDFPSFEVEPVNHRPIEQAWLEANDGRAFKWLDPHHSPLHARARAPTVAAIWLDRDPIEQARSQAKFASLVFGVPAAGRHDLRRWAAGLRRDRARCWSALQFNIVAAANFETILREPDAYAGTLGTLAWTLMGVEFDQLAAAAVCRARSARCAPGLELEFELIAQAEAQA